ncbi:MAG: hypothetical protein KKH99_06520, partial [Proteobacteria bacterium]|nr:hypothetical protein [Pseudomonadota bacterium]
MKCLKKTYILAISGLICLSVFFSTEVFAEEPIHPGYPFVFSATGKLVRISAKEQEMVLDDTLYKLSSDTTYHSFDIVFANANSFNINDRIGVILRDKEKNEV